MTKKLLVTPAPHITKPTSANIMMWAMIVALLPTAISGVMMFGFNALYIMLVSVGCSYVFDVLIMYSREKKFIWNDFSSIVTGLMVALVLPVTVPLYVPIIGSFLAIVIFKGCFGGLGKNIFNPTAAARVVLGLIFTGLTLELYTGTALGENVASPLAYFVNGDYSTITLRSMFFGNVPGAIGTASILCILVSGIVLMIFGITEFVIPVGSIITFVATTWIGGGAISIVPFLFSGGFMFATMFMITDPTTSPITVWGKLVYGLLYGLVAGLFRVFFIFGETSPFVAVLVVNLVAPLLDKIFAPKPIGVRRRA